MFSFQDSAGLRVIQVVSCELGALLSTHTLQAFHAISAQAYFPFALCIAQPAWRKPQMALMAHCSDMHGA